VSAGDVQRIANDLFRDDGLAATVVGPATDSVSAAQLKV
jgi:hypothetical protein